MNKNRVGPWHHLLAALLIALLLPLAATASDPAPRQMVEQISDRLQRLLTSDPGRLAADPEGVYAGADEIIAPHVDFDRVGRLVLGKYWRRATPEQRQRFIAEFRRLVVRSYSTAFNDFGEWEIRYLPVRRSEDGRRAVVRTRVTRPGAEPVEVAYHMHRRDGRWLAYDVKVDGISLITNYRNSFSREIRRAGVDGLIRKLSAMNQRHLKGNDLAAN